MFTPIKLGMYMSFSLWNKTLTRAFQEEAEEDR